MPASSPKCNSSCCKSQTPGTVPIARATPPWSNFNLTTREAAVSIWRVVGVPITMPLLFPTSAVTALRIKVPEVVVASCPGRQLTQASTTYIITAPLGFLAELGPRGFYCKTLIPRPPACCSQWKVAATSLGLPARVSVLAPVSAHLFSACSPPYAHTATQFVL
ncbi:uncharacterized protein CCOS01_02800 [Colletotrichum costaricense]|uniref:Uncharacterized protein n=1 Tax=Colletotrichum costaricense TaxID=1209916 RepID=A0AAI9Z3M3_9PEZI|nr:uncharacterized protein CCOS01_02800 [Colletotrichum costaricense]KAK1534048.1 hypothetical protein CCOS01_02800 [Colletotrichum costaricense]